MVASGGASSSGPGARPGGRSAAAQEALREAASGLLADGAVDVVIGYGVSAAGDVVPRFVSRSEDASALVWDERCVYNLVRYLTDRDLLGTIAVAAAGGAAEPPAREPQSQEGGRPPRIAVTVKGCDLRSLVVLLGESQVHREALTVIGLPCGGVVDDAGRRLDKCLACPAKVRNLREPGGYEPPVDLVVGGPVSEDFAAAGDFRDVGEMEALSRGERRAFWDACFARCLRCYACRNVCPLCYCRECVFDQHDPRWVSPAAGVSSNRAFHLIRAYHLAGRCVDCGECERACPVGIPLRRINRKAAQVVKEAFDFEAGTTLEGKAPIAAFAATDPEEFIE